MKSTTMLLAGALLAATGPVLAVDFRPDAASAAVGFGANGLRVAGVGLVWNWDFHRLRHNTELTAQTELVVNRWSFHPLPSGSEQLTQVVLLPVLRMRLSRGASPWFVELGIGASYLDRDYETRGQRFSTRWNFHDVLGVGRTFGGPQGVHELGLRLSHTSNAGIRNPNPGENLLQLRYAYRF